MVAKKISKSQPIILLSPGRSGSTLLQRIVNTSEKVIIWGEHNGFLSQVAASYFNITCSQQMEKLYYSKLDEIQPEIITNSYCDYDKNINWLNSFNKENNKTIYRNFIFSILNQNITVNEKRWGFKEIRYSINDQTVDMITDLFPDSKFIFSIRNPLDILTSMMLDFTTHNKKEEILEQKDDSMLFKILKNFIDRVKVFYDSLVRWDNNQQLNSITIKYEDLLSEKEQSIQKIFGFLDVPIPQNAYEPFSFKLGNTKNYKHHDMIRNYILNEKDTIYKLLGESINEFGY